MQGGSLPEPLPLGVAVIDFSVSLFGHVFHQLSCKHRKQLLTHFRECIKQAKPANRQQAIQINIFSAFLAGLKVRCTNGSMFYFYFNAVVYLYRD